MNENLSPLTPDGDTLHHRFVVPENIVLGGIAGLAAALLGAALWATITYYTKYQIGFMAVGIGFLVGIAMRKLGDGHSAAFGVLAAILALLGCVCGNLLSACAFVSDEMKIPLLQTVSKLTPSLAVELLKEGFSPIDALFYFLAISGAFRTSRGG